MALEPAPPTQQYDPPPQKKILDSSKDQTQPLSLLVSLMSKIEKNEHCFIPILANICLNTRCTK